MTPDEAARMEQFLGPSRIAVVATIGKGGVPHVTPNWYVYADGKIAISITKERVKYRNLSRDSRLTVCIYSEPSALDYAIVSGEADIRDDESIWPVTKAIVERYVPPEGVDARMRELRTQNRVIIYLAPKRVLFRT